MIRSPSSRAYSSGEALRGPVLRAAAVLLLGAASALTAAPGANGRPLFSRPYPLYAAPSFPGAVFHWIDSLAGTSAGKTIPAHQAEFVRRFGRPTDEDRRQIAAFLRARAEYLEHAGAGTAAGGPARGAEMLRVFCDAASLDAALSEVKPAISPAAWAGLAGAIAWFRPKYETIWNGGSVPLEFLARARSDRGLDRLAKLLSRIAAFYRVDPGAASPPRLALVPVPPGYGTHAQEIGNVLLLEIRPGDDLSEEASVIVHENAHWLYGLVSEDRKARLAAFAHGLGPEERDAFALLGEAIPTALGQGIAGREFEGRAWTEEAPWYHLRDVDACAKAIYPVVRRTVAAGGTLDETFLRSALAAAVKDRPAVTRRSP